MAIIETRITVIKPGTYSRPLAIPVHRCDLIVRDQQVPVMPPGWVPLSQRHPEHFNQAQARTRRWRTL